MSTFFLIFGIIAFIVGLILLAIGLIDDDEDFLLSGIIIGVLGLFCTIGSLIVKLPSDNKQNVAINQPEIVTDSTHVQVMPDSIYAVQYIITWKTDEEIKCGDIIMKGKTEKEVGDTITINLK